MKIKFPYLEEAPAAEAPGGGGGAPDPAPAAAPAQAPAVTDQTPAPAENFFSSLPESWRNDLVSAAGYEGDDAKKYAGQLERVSDLPVLVKNYFNAQDRIRKGELSNGLPENPTDQQLADWREANGIPTTPDDYKVTLGEGLVLGDVDQRILENVYPVAHNHNVPASAVNEMVNAFMTARQHEQDALMNQDNVDRQTSERTLREAWGNDYLTNINAISGLVAQLPEGTRDAFKSARMPDGTAVFNDPSFVVAMGEWARRLNPSATVVPNSNNPVKAISDEIKQLEAKMGTPEWFKDKDAQQRYLDLIDAKAQMDKQ